MIPTAFANPVYQMAFLVDDLEDAAAIWHRQSGAGPFFVIPRFAFLEPRYRGRADAPDISIALGYSGDVMLELIVDHGAPSVFNEVARSGTGPTLHHVAQLTDDMDATLAAFAAAGSEIPFEALFPPDTRAAFVDTRSTIGCFTEIIANTPPLVAVQQIMRAATDGWDGRDLIRGFE
jgi:methylmalonyl-CoA/ethylmalonyl-CoA epimerase